MSSDDLLLESRDGSRPGHRVLVLSGPLSLMTVPLFLKAIRAETAPVVILHFRGVSFVDSAGVGAMIQALTSFRREQRRLAFVELSDRTRAVLEVTRVKSILPIFDTLAQAEERLA